MGFSVSGSAAIIFAGLFIAFGMWQTAASNGFERVSEAQQDSTDQMLAQQNTAIEIRNASYGTETVNGQDYYLLDVNVTNNGTEPLSLNRTDVLINNVYQTGWRDGATVDGDAGTDLWLPGEKLAVEFNTTYQPNRTKIATETGVSASSEVTAA